MLSLIQNVLLCSCKQIYDVCIIKTNKYLLEKYNVE